MPTYAQMWLAATCVILQITKLKQQLQQGSKPAASGVHDKDRQCCYAHGSCSLGATQVLYHHHQTNTEAHWDFIVFYYYCLCPVFELLRQVCNYLQEVSELKHWSNRKITTSHVLLLLRKKGLVLLLSTAGHFVVFGNCTLDLVFEACGHNCLK